MYAYFNAVSYRKVPWYDPQHHESILPLFVTNDAVLNLPANTMDVIIIKPQQGRVNRPIYGIGISTKALSLCIHCTLVRTTYSAFRYHV